MATSAVSNYLQPGSDSLAHVIPLHQQVASSLSEAVGARVGPEQVAPAAQQVPTHPLITKPDTDLEISDLKEQEPAEAGSSGNFLKVFLQRLREQHPGGRIKKEE